LPSRVAIRVCLTLVQEIASPSIIKQKPEVDFWSLGQLAKSRLEQSMT